MDQLLIDASKALFSNGILGIAVVGLVYYVMMQRGENRAEREAHRIELAEKDKLIQQLYDRLVQQGQAGYAGLEAVQKSLASIAINLERTSVSTNLQRGSTQR